MTTSILPIRTALLSYGMSGEVFHGPLLSVHKGFSLVKILERSKNRAKDRYPDATVVQSLDEVLSDKEIELVFVNTPHDTHYEYADQALRAGKHVVVEKPFTNTVSEGRKLIDLCEEKNLVLTVFQNRRWDGDFMTVKKVIESGMLGRIVEFEAHYDRYRPQVDHTTWKETAGQGAGILYNLGSHMIDQALQLFGLPKFVDARLGIQRKGGTAPDYYDIRLEYEGVCVTLKSGYLVRKEGPRYIVHGESGSFMKWGIDPQEQALKEGKIPGTINWGCEDEDYWGAIKTQQNGVLIEGKVETIPGNYLGFYNSIYDSIRHSHPIAVSPRDALSVIQIIELAEQSNREKRAIKNQV